MNIYNLEINFSVGENAVMPLSVDDAVHIPVSFPNGEYQDGWSIRLWKTKQGDPVGQFLVSTLDPTPGTVVKCLLPEWTAWGKKEFKIMDKVKI